MQQRDNRDQVHLSVAHRHAGMSAIICLGDCATKGNCVLAPEPSIVLLFCLG